MNRPDVATWERTWDRAAVAAAPSWDFIFREIERHVRFEGKRTLELGCGKGSLSFLALRAGAAHVTLVDFSESALALARHLLRREPAEKVTYVRANLLDVQLGRNFDMVMSSGVAEHFDGREVAACVRQHVCHSRDKVAICVPSNTVFNRRRSRSLDNIARYGFQRALPDREMRRLLEEAGARVIHNRRFQVSYGVHLPGRALPGVGKAQEVLFKALRPWERWLGGLLLAIATVRPLAPGSTGFTDQGA